MANQKTNYVTTTTNKPFTFNSERELKALLVELNSQYTFDSIPSEFITGTEKANETIKNSKAFDLVKSKKANTIFSKLVKISVKDNLIANAFDYPVFTLTIKDNQLDFEKSDKYFNLTDLVQCLTGLEKKKQANDKLTQANKQAIKRYFIGKESESLLNCMIAQATIQNAFESEKVMEYSVDIIGTYKEYANKHNGKNPFDSDSNNSKAMLCNDLLATFGVTDIKANNNFAKAFYGKIAFFNKNQDNQNLNTYGALWQFILASRKQFNNIASKTIDKAKVLKVEK